MNANEGIMIFKDTFEYLTECLLDEHQFCELARMIYNSRFNGVIYSDGDIEDKQLRMIWKTLKHSINKSSQNARAYERKIHKAENKSSEPSKEEASTPTAITPQQPSIMPQIRPLEPIIEESNSVAPIAPIKPKDEPNPNELEEAIKFYRKEENQHLIMEKNAYYYSYSSSARNREKYDNSGISESALKKAFEILRKNYEEKQSQKRNALENTLIESVALAYS